MELFRNGSRCHVLPCHDLSYAIGRRTRENSPMSEENFADAYERLVQEQAKRGQAEKERQDQERQAAAAQRDQERAIPMNKAEELAALFRQFHGRKICGGKVELVSDWSRDDNDVAVMLRTRSVPVDLQPRFPKNDILFSAVYYNSDQKYHLFRHFPVDLKRDKLRRSIMNYHDPKEEVGTSQTPQELMQALMQQMLLLEAPPHE